MKLRSIRALLIAALAGALLGLGCAATAGQVYEARATVWVSAPEALTVLPEILEAQAPALSAYAIPGTCLMEAAVRTGDAATSATGLENALSDLNTVLSYLGLTAESEVLRSGIRLLPGISPVTAAGIGCLGGLLLALMVLSPAPKAKPPLSIPDILRRMLGLGRKWWLPMLGVVILFAAGNFLRETPAQPVYRSTALVRVGDFRQETAATVFQGLLNCGLSEESVSASPLGKSNLIRLSAQGVTPAQARDALQSAIDHWPELEHYALEDLPLTVLEPPTLPDSSEASTNLPTALSAGGGAGILLCLTILFMCATGEEKSPAGRYRKD